jgi:hypothetical protein
MVRAPARHMARAPHTCALAVPALLTALDYHALQAWAAPLYLAQLPS